MHFLTTLVSLSAFATLAAHAAPMPEVADAFDLSFEARGVALEDYDLLDMRDEIDDALYDLSLREILDDLELRSKFGWGLRKQPPSAQFKTPSGTYTGKEVNKVAKDALKKVQEGTKDRGYPKPGSGFRKSEAHLDPTKGKGESYHAPIGKKGTKHPGPDRVIVNKKPGHTKFDSHVAFHDPKKPIPQGTGSKNHPFTKGKKKFGGKGK